MLVPEQMTEDQMKVTIFIIKITFEWNYKIYTNLRNDTTNKAIWSSFEKNNTKTQLHRDVLTRFLG